MQVLTVALFQRTGAIGNSFYIIGDSPRMQTFWGQKPGVPRNSSMQIFHVVYNQFCCNYFEATY